MCVETFIANLYRLQFTDDNMSRIIF